MKKQTVGLFFLMFLVIFIIGLILILMYNSEKHLTFYAEVSEVYGENAILVPFPDQNVSGELSANIINVKVGEIVKVICKKEIKETYPAIIEVVSFQSIIKPTTSTTLIIDIPDEYLYDEDTPVIDYENN